MAHKYRIHVNDPMTYWTMDPPNEYWLNQSARRDAALECRNDGEESEVNGYHATRSRCYGTLTHGDVQRGDHGKGDSHVHFVGHDEDRTVDNRNGFRKRVHSRKRPHFGNSLRNESNAFERQWVHD